MGHLSHSVYTISVFEVGFSNQLSLTEKPWPFLKSIGEIPLHSIQL